MEFLVVKDSYLIIYNENNSKALIVLAHWAVLCFPKTFREFLQCT